MTIVSNPIRVLLVEDDEEDFILTRGMLREAEPAGFVLHWEADIERAMTLLLDGGFDVCLVDYRLGERDGIEFIRDAGAVAATPMILLTGEADRTIDLAAMEAGAADFLNKAHLTPALLERSIRYSIQQKRAEEQRVRLVAEQAARAEAEAANRSKDMFLATLSHELRTPLNAILGWTQILRTHASIDQDVQQGLETIERNARSQARLIEDLLDVSRIVSGKLRLESKPVTLSAVVEAALDAVRPAGAEKQIDIRSTVHAATITVDGDASRLQQVVWNLLTNAIKFTPAGGRVDVEVRPGDAMATITVTDNGPGVDPQFLPHVFDRFRQADGSSTRRHGGLGLGLSIVRHLVELHSGTVHAANREQADGGGAVFSVRLPLSTSPTRPPEGEPAPARDKVMDLARVRILVVDDEPDALELIARLLRRCGADVTSARSVDQALQALQMNTVDVLVSDIAMPGEDGFELIRRVRAAGQVAHRIPAVALTAFAREEDQARMLSAGFSAHLSKPVDPAKLTALIAELVQPSRA